MFRRPNSRQSKQAIRVIHSFLAGRDDGYGNLTSRNGELLLYGNLIVERNRQGACQIYNGGHDTITTARILQLFMEIARPDLNHSQVIRIHKGLLKIMYIRDGKLTGRATLITERDPIIVYPEHAVKPNENNDYEKAKDNQKDSVGHSI